MMHQPCHINNKAINIWPADYNCRLEQKIVHKQDITHRYTTRTHTDKANIIGCNEFTLISSCSNSEQ
ncbi:MAG: hypothetical protein [Betabaculovirus sp.]|nr:MAG: hypothetical protein [Betabaculovirus sp.]